MPTRMSFLLGSSATARMPVTLAPGSLERALNCPSRSLGEAYWREKTLAARMLSEASRAWMRLTARCTRVALPVRSTPIWDWRGWMPMPCTAAFTGSTTYPALT